MFRTINIQYIFHGWIIVHVWQGVRIFRINTVSKMVYWRTMNSQIIQQERHVDSDFRCSHTLRKHTHSNILKILQPKKEHFQKKILHFHIPAKNIDYPQSVFWAEIKNNVFPCKPQFYCIKWDLRGSKLYRRVFVMILQFRRSHNFASTLFY